MRVEGKAKAVINLIRYLPQRLLLKFEKPEKSLFILSENISREFNCIARGRETKSKHYFHDRLLHDVKCNFPSLIYRHLMGTHTCSPR